MASPQGCQFVFRGLDDEKSRDVNLFLHTGCMNPNKIDSKIDMNIKNTSNKYDNINYAW